MTHKSQQTKKCYIFYVHVIYICYMNNSKINILKKYTYNNFVDKYNILCFNSQSFSIPEWLIESIISK